MSLTGTQGPRSVQRGEGGAAECSGLVGLGGGAGVQGGVQHRVGQDGPDTRQGLGRAGATPGQHTS